ncbi:MAG: aspartate--tRNA ligase [Oscillospiraceae bacterium]|jgi:aspartyl-tRNA synthetase|nr:aspartate--tRNA ligase [Oscillospiraceae bacterium]
MDHLGTNKRTHSCGDLRLAHSGQAVAVAGWVQRQRDLGALIFVDLRDRTGLVQLAFDENSAPALFEKAQNLHSEYVIFARGAVRERSAKNAELPTGDVEIAVQELLLLAKSDTPPFEIIENCPTGEPTRLKYRYLDLRRPDLQRNLLQRYKIVKLTRDYFDQHGFIEIETPTLIKSTPEGARDYIVPSRLRPGSVYALPQSPQLYKQLCMVAGFDRYVQLARCYRDEDLRADRQPEFTQIDLEMSFTELPELLDMVEGYIQFLVGNLALSVQFPLPRLPYREALTRYGSDKPDTRYGMELFDAGELLQSCGFAVFEGALAAGGAVRGVTAKAAHDALTRKEIDKLTEFAKGVGAKGLAWARLAPDGSIASSFGKFLPEETMRALLQAANAVPGDVVFLVADGKASLTLNVLGLLRQQLAKKLDLIPADKLNFLWVTEMPFFDWDEETNAYIAMHHPFTAPTDATLPLLEIDKGSVVAKAADLVLNGIEMSSGSVRITDPALQARIFASLGLTEEEINAKFGFLVEAFRYGAPPHCGMGLGLDRLVMQLLGCESLRDVVAFPKLQNASEPMTDCPAPADAAQLRELGLASFLEKKDAKEL